MALIGWDSTAKCYGSTVTAINYSGTYEISTQQPSAEPAKPAKKFPEWWPLTNRKGDYWYRRLPNVTKEEYRQIRKIKQKRIKAAQQISRKALKVQRKRFARRFHRRP